jgi:hypothetical protein
MPTMSLGEMMNLARGAQAYQQAEQVNPELAQQARQTTQTGAISLSLEQQKERERNLITEFLKNPANFQTNGRVDINKLNAEIPRIAPLTGADWMQKYTTLGNAQTNAISAAQNLTQTQREMIASRLAIMGRLGVNDKRAYLAELDLLVKENPNNRELATLVDSYKTTLGAVPEGANLPSLAISGANSLLNVQTQQQLFAPQAGTISSGAATFPTTTTPSVAGGAPSVQVGGTPLVVAQLPPGSREVFSGQYDMNNQPIVNVYSESGRFLGQRSAGETPPASALPGVGLPTPLGGAAPPRAAPAAAPVPAPSAGATFTAPTKNERSRAGVNQQQDIAYRQDVYNSQMEMARQLRATNPAQAEFLEEQAQRTLAALTADYGITVAAQPAPVTPQPVIQSRPAGPGTTPVARLRPGETPQTMTEANQIRSASANAAQQVPLQTFNNNQIIKLADDVILGRGANFIGALTGGYAALPFTTDNATNLNQLGHYMALQTASLANSSGLGGTDAARGIAGEISGTTSWTAPAIKQTARVNRALSTATDLFNQGVQNAFGKSNDPFAARDFQNKWSQTVDINAVRLFDAMRNNDKDAIKEVVTAAGGPNSPGYKRLVDNIGAMQRLIRGQ